MAWKNSSLPSNKQCGYIVSRVRKPVYRTQTIHNAIHAFTTSVNSVDLYQLSCLAGVEALPLLWDSIAVLLVEEAANSDATGDIADVADEDVTWQRRPFQQELLST